MTPDDRRPCLEIVIGFAELKGKKLSTPALELYWTAMQAWDLQDFRAAANHLLKTCEFMPTPKDFEDLRKAGRMKAGEAWAFVLDRVRKGASHWEGMRPNLNARFEAQFASDATVMARAVAATRDAQQ